MAKSASAVMLSMADPTLNRAQIALYFDAVFQTSFSFWKKYKRSDVDLKIRAMR